MVNFFEDLFAWRMVRFADRLVGTPAPPENKENEMPTSRSGAGTPGAIPLLTAAGAPAPTAPGVPATGALGTPPGAPAPSAPAPAAPPATAPAATVPALTADDVRAWLTLRGVAATDMDIPEVRTYIVSLEGCALDRQLSNTLGWIRDELVANGKPGFDPAGVTVVSLKAEIAAAAAAMAPPAPAGPKPPSRVYLAVLWCLGFMNWALSRLRPLGKRAVRGFASAGRRVGRRWKPILAATAGLALLATVIFIGIKGYEWWQLRANEAAQTPPAPPLPVIVAPTPTPPPPVVVAPTPTPPPPVAIAPAPTPIQPVIPGPTSPAIYHPQLDMECLMYGRLQSCTLPPGCTEGFISNPPRLQVSCPGGIVYTDGKSMTEYPANQRVSVRLNRL